MFRLACGVLCVWLLLGCEAQPSEPRSIRFRAVMDDAPLVRNQRLYSNPGGAGQYSVRDFQFYASNFRLHASQGVYAEPHSYHLVRFDLPRGVFRIDLEEVPAWDFHTLEFMLGVDAAANASLESIGDLDPNGRMAWNWEVGYKFLLLEGMLEVAGRSVPLVYHIGFDENAAVVSLDIETRNTEVIDVEVDVAQLFHGEAPPLDLAALNNVKFDREDSGRLARNFAHMFRLKTNRTGGEP